MTKLMLEAIEALRRLPEDQQDDIAGTVLRLAEAEIARDDLVSDEEARSPASWGSTLSVTDIRISIEESRARGHVISAEDVFDRVEGKLSGSKL